MQIVDINEVYANNEASDMRANGAQKSANKSGTISESTNSNGIKCLNDNEENNFV